VTLYLAATLAYLVVLPALGTPDAAGPVERGIAYARSDRVGSAAMEAIIGRPGAFVMAAAILVSTFGCVNGLVLSGARVSYAMAKDGLFFPAAGRLSTAGTPTTALVLQGVWASLLALSGTYGDLLDYVIFAALLFYAATVIAALRFGERAGRARRMIAIAYVVVAGAIMLDLLIVKPRYTWPGLLIVATGVPVYAWWRRRAPASVS
jgi:APA family basic amino acid/polyamine antiporter